MAGFDATAQYKGFSAQFESHIMKLEPQSAGSALFAGLPAETNGGYVLCRGYYGQVNWFSKKLKSIFSLRCEELNLSDLVKGSSQRWGGAYAYQMRGTNAMIKLQYWHVLTEEAVLDPLKWTDQVRLGFQYQFN